MIRIRALNGEESSNDSVSDDPSSAHRRPTKEVLEEEALDLYNSSLQLISKSDSAKAAAGLEKLLTLPYLNEHDSKKDSPTQFQIKLGCLKNLGSIYFSLNPDAEAAVRVYLQATKLDPTNVNLWYRLGIVSMKIVDYDLAYSCFHQGLQCNPSHWGCLENVITLAYVLNDSAACLKFCCSGLTKDSKFIRGLVFRDHIFALHPHLKESLKSVTLDWDILNNKQEYEVVWKEKYINEARELIKAQQAANKRLKEEEAAERSKVAMCSHSLRAYTFAELSRVVLLFYEDIRALGSFLRPIQLTREADTLSGESGESSFILMEEDIEKTEDNSQSSNPNRSSADEKENGTSNNGSGTEAASENTCEVEENGDVHMEEVNGVDSGEKETEEESATAKERARKAKKDVKWWQLEGKRRSQRNRGNPTPQSQVITKKESGFAERLTSIIPATILCGLSAEDEKSEGTKTGEIGNKTDEKERDYFGSEEEISDVKKFVLNYGKTNIMEVVSRLSETLASLSDRQWPSELAAEYLKLFTLYRIHVPRPDPFSLDEYIQECQESDSFITLIMLELLLDGISRSTVDKVTSREKFTTELFQVRQVCRVLEERNLLVRFHWLLSKYYLTERTVNDENQYGEAFYYLNEVDTDLKTYYGPGDIIRTPALSDNCISLEELQKKFSLVSRLENVTRINELYESKQYEDLVDILSLCMDSQDAGTCDVTNKFYLADSFFHLSNYSGCIHECMDIISGKAKIPPPESIFIKTITLLERVCQVPFLKLSSQQIRKISNSMVTLLISYDQQQFGAVPPILLTTPWCILYNLLYQVEAQNPALYLDVDQDSTPNSILLLQFAHQFLSRDGNCTLNNGKLLNFTLEALLPLVASDEYSEFEGLTHCIEQAVSCLYSHPSKIAKLKYLTDHGCTGIPLEWSTCQQLYLYFKPTKLPEFDSYDQINLETEGLFIRILEIVPPDVKPVEAYTELKEFLSGETDVISKTSSDRFPSNLIDIYYLLGDYHFKTKEWTKALDDYTWDLAVAPYRFDSWAAISLAKGEMINSQLNSSEKFNSKDIISSANVVLTCFRKALDLEPSNSKLRIEFGSFAYSMHSFCSRLLTSGAEAQLSLETFNFVDSKKEEFLAAAAKCFEPLVHDVDNEKTGTDPSQKDDPWIHHYMLGKVMEKLDPHIPEKFLEQYELAGKLLHEHGAMYPAKISYYSPQQFAIEALEIYYRIHASILTYIEKHEYSKEMEEILLGFVERAADSPFMKVKLKRLEQAAETKRKRPNDKDLTEVRLILDGMLDEVAKLEKEEEQKRTELSSSSLSSSDPSTDNDSSDTSSDSSVVIEDQVKPVSFGLSAFCEKLKEKELREGKLAEEAAAAAKAAADKAAEDKLKEEQLKSLTTVSPKMQAIEENFHFKNIKFSRIISQCIKAMQECISRFPTHHKSYYRISHVYFTFCKSHLKTSKEWLLGTGLANKKISGLFGDRKSTNFFNGVWRNPVEDIDRPGSFPYHMAKTVQILLEVLTELHDHESLTEIGIHLAKTPDSDKKCLYDTEREQFSQQAFTNAVAAAKRLLNDEKRNGQDVAMTIFSSYVKLQKFSAKENPMANLLLNAYKKFMRSKGLEPEDVTVDNAFKYYQHLAWRTKISESRKGYNAKANSIVPYGQDFQPVSGALQNGSAGYNLSTKTNATNVQRKVNAPRRQVHASGAAVSCNPPGPGPSTAAKYSPTSQASSLNTPSTSSQHLRLQNSYSNSQSEMPLTSPAHKVKNPNKKPRISKTTDLNTASMNLLLQGFSAEFAQNYLRQVQSFLQNSSTANLASLFGTGSANVGNRMPSLPTEEFILPDSVFMSDPRSNIDLTETCNKTANIVSNSGTKSNVSAGNPIPALSAEDFILPDSVHLSNPRTTIRSEETRKNNLESKRNRAQSLLPEQKSAGQNLSNLTQEKSAGQNLRNLAPEKSAGQKLPLEKSAGENLTPEKPAAQDLIQEQTPTPWRHPLITKLSTKKHSYYVDIAAKMKRQAEVKKYVEAINTHIPEDPIPEQNPVDPNNRKLYSPSSYIPSKRSLARSPIPDVDYDTLSVVARRNGFTKEEYIRKHGYHRISPIRQNRGTNNPQRKEAELPMLNSGHSSKYVQMNKTAAQLRPLPKLQHRPSTTAEYGNCYGDLLSKTEVNLAASAKSSSVKLPQVSQLPNFTNTLMNSVDPSGVIVKPKPGTRGLAPSLFKPVVSTGVTNPLYNPVSQRNQATPVQKPQAVAKKRIRKPSPSILKEPTTPPPTSMPAHPRYQLNTSPFKASASIFVSPGLSTGPGLYFGQDLQISRVERSATPPAAHSANRTSPYSSSNGGPEIIDLTTNKSPISHSGQLSGMMHPETSNNDSLGKGVKRAFPTNTPSGPPVVLVKAVPKPRPVTFQTNTPTGPNFVHMRPVPPRPTSQANTADVQMKPVPARQAFQANPPVVQMKSVPKPRPQEIKAQCPLPPKKKPMLRPAPIMIPIPAPPPPEVITLE